eukprot:TRINITY_DN58518_c0_g1_i1.p1 TRINITY_DN58518_c0_g1~~TRINITY_DN58518_c0_g1_i1.p1  ORF type:complete len:652 (-),score=95.60 TRINITY_DN58518_c0_g1_i1:215-2143(-)
MDCSSHCSCRHRCRTSRAVSLALPSSAAALAAALLLQQRSSAWLPGSFRWTREQRSEGTRLLLRAAAAAAETPEWDIGSKYIDQGDVDAATAWDRIEQLRQRLLSYSDLPAFNRRPATDNAGLLWWFLRDRRLDVNEAEQKLVKCLRWRQEFRVERLGPELFAKEMRTRKGYIHRHTDVAGRPVLVTIARRHNVFARSLQESSQMCAWMLETALGSLSMLEPPSRGGDEAPSPSPPPEQALGIFDLRDFSPLQADLEVAIFLIEVLYNYYPGRTGRVLLVGAPDLFKSFWKEIKPLLGHYSSLADFVTAEELCDRYFEPGLEPPEFSSNRASLDQSTRRLGAQRRLAALQERVAGSSLRPLAFAGGTLCAAAMACRSRRKVARAALEGVGTRRIGGGPREWTIDDETIERYMEELRLQLCRTPGLKWQGRPAAENRALLWWFLRDRHFDVAEAAEKLVRCLRWRQDFRVERLCPELFAKEARTRKAYLHQHADLLGRPALVVIARRHNVMERDLNESCSMCAWYMERMLDRVAMTEPLERVQSASSSTEQVEQALAVVDLSGFSPLQADFDFVCFMIEVMHNYYPGRFARVLLVDAPDIFESFWKSVSPLLHRYKDLADFISAREVCRRYFAAGLAPPELQR